MVTHCPICGKPLSELEIVVSEHDLSYQCHNCWNRIRVGKQEQPDREFAEVGSSGHPHGDGSRRPSHGRGRKS